MNLFPWVPRADFERHETTDRDVHTKTEGTLTEVVTTLKRVDDRLAAVEPGALTVQMRQAVATELANRAFWTTLKKKVAAVGIVLATAIGAAAGIHEMWADIRSWPLLTNVFGHPAQSEPSPEQAQLPSAGPKPAPAEAPSHGGATK